MKQTQSGTLLILLAAMLWGTTGTAQALAPAGATHRAGVLLALHRRS